VSDHGINPQKDGTLMFRLEDLQVLNFWYPAVNYCIFPIAINSVPSVLWSLQSIVNEILAKSLKGNFLDFERVHAITCGYC